ncbi:hypothetical protein [Sedimentibacter sp.]|nr:hypothetical protein [Sedimentibacter sp.]
MNNALKESIKFIFISLIVSLIVYKSSNLGVDFFAYIFVYFLSFFILSFWLNNNNIKWGIKILLAVFIGIIGFTTIAYFYGSGKILTRYTIAFCVVYICFIVVNYIKKKLIKNKII